MSEADQLADDGSVSDAERTIADPAASAEAAPSEEAVADPANAGDNPEVLSVESLLSTLETVTAERDENFEHWQRVSAEFANFRKQTEKRNAEMAAQAGSRLAEALLPVLDACDAAAQQGVEGIDQVASQLKGVLERQGLELIADEAEVFDPNRHEAAMTEPGDDDQTEPVVAQVLRTGYAWNGRVLRAAMVKVKG